jgi:hypothetical protein
VNQEVFLKSGDIFQLLETRAVEAAKRIGSLCEENKNLQIHNGELTCQRERACEKVRELLSKLCLSDE